MKRQHVCAIRSSFPSTTAQFYLMALTSAFGTGHCATCWSGLIHCHQKCCRHAKRIIQILSTGCSILRNFITTPPPFPTFFGPKQVIKNYSLTPNLFPCIFIKSRGYSVDILSRFQLMSPHPIKCTDHFQICYPTLDLHKNVRRKLILRSLPNSSDTK